MKVKKQSTTKRQEEWNQREGGLIRVIVILLTSSKELTNVLFNHQLSLPVKFDQYEKE